MRIDFKKPIFIISCLLFLAISACSFTTNNNDDNPGKDALLIDLLNHVVKNMHFDYTAMDDKFSAAAYDSYLEALDPFKRYFLASDVEEFNQYRLLIDDHFEAKDLSFFNLTYDRLATRIKESQEINDLVLSKAFDFNLKETIDTDYEKLAFAKNREELINRWRQQLKFSALSTYHDKLELQKQKADSLPDFKIRPLGELEKEARESVQTSMKESFDFLEERTREDYFGIYLNAIVETYDPHTSYFPPITKERFDISISGSLEGIGARLQKKSNEVHIVELISGGPAWKSELLEEGDIILKVAQEKDTIATDISIMRLDDAIKLIKGPKGSKVRLTVKKKLDGSLQEITLVRDLVEIEETYAKASVTEIENQRFGIIHLPKFYFDMDNYKNRNAATDIEKLILELKEENIKGLILDLRNNGGGSLQTVVDITGLFIGKGPVVQVATKDDKINVLRNRSNNVVWDGPLVLLVNELSASASEILAGALQDYERAIILGSEQTYGKGTVQNVVDLNRWVRNSSYGDMGALKVTTQKYYRVSGGSTQLEGVKSDVVTPDRFMYIPIGEKDNQNPMPYDVIPKTDFKKWKSNVSLSKLIKNSKKRVKENSNFDLIAESAQRFKERRDQSEYSLNIADYIAELEADKEEAKKYEVLNKYDNTLSFQAPKAEVALIEKDSSLAEKRQRWYKNLKKDLYVEEAIYILLDAEGITYDKSALATKK